MQSGWHSKIASKVMDNFCWPWNICAVLITAYHPQTMKLDIKIIVFTFHPIVYISYLCEFHYQFVKSFGASHNFKLIIRLGQNICKCGVPYITISSFWMMVSELYTLHLYTMIWLVVTKVIHWQKDHCLSNSSPLNSYSPRP